MAEQNDSLEALDKNQPPTNTTISKPSKRDNERLSNASNFIPNAYKSSEKINDNNLSRSERITLEENKIQASLRKSKTDKNSTSHKGINIEFSDQKIQSENDKNTINTDDNYLKNLSDTIKNKEPFDMYAALERSRNRYTNNSNADNEIPPPTSADGSTEWNGNPYSMSSTELEIQKSINESKKSFQNTNQNNPRSNNKENISLNKLTKKLAEAERKSNQASLNTKQKIEDHDKTIENAKKLKQQTYDKTTQQIKPASGEIKLTKIDESKINELDDNFKKRYVVDRKNQYRLAYNNHKIAFRDYGNKITTTSNDILDHKDMVKLKQSQGATHIYVSGTADFRSNVWREAKQRGMDVSGHIPSKEDLKSIKPENTIENKTPEKNDEKINNEHHQSQREKEIRHQLNAPDRHQIAKTEPQIKALLSHEKAVTMEAKKNVHPESQAKYIKNVMDIQIKRAANGEKISHIKVVEKESTLER